MEYFKNKSFGFYLSFFAAVFALAAFAMYHQVKRSESFIEMLLMIVVVLQILGMVALKLIPRCKWINLVMTVNSVLVAAALVNSFSTQVDSIGYVVSGLYEFEIIRNFVISAGLMMISMLCYIISSYIGFQKNEM